MEWKDSSVTLPIPKQNELTNLIAQNGRKLELPAKKIFLEPGDKLKGIYYIAEGRTRHYMIAPDGTEKLLYTLSAGWFYGETPCVLDDATGKELGKLDKVLHYPAHKVYQVRGGAHEYLIPAVPEVFIASADPDAGIIRVHMMKGLATDEN